MAQLFLPSDTDLSLALSEPYLLEYWKKANSIQIADKFKDAAVFIHPFSGTGVHNDLKLNWNGSSSNLTAGVDNNGYHFGPTTGIQSGNTLSTALPAGTDRTIVAVFKLNTLNGTFTHPLDADRDNGNRHFQFRLNSSGVLQYIVWNGINTATSSNSVSNGDLVVAIGYTDHANNILGVSLQGVDSEISYTSSLVALDEFFLCGTRRSPFNFDGHLYFAGAWNRCFTAEERKEIYKHPFGALTKPANDSPFIIGAAAAGDVPLTVQEATHGHTVDNLDLTQASTLSVAEALHAHTADNLDLVQASTLTVAESLHGHIADNIILDVGETLVVQEAVHTHTVDNIDLTQAHTITVNEALHGHVVDNIDLVQASTLAVAEATHTHTVDNIVLDISAVLVMQEALHGHTADNLDLIQASVLDMQEALHGHVTDNIDLITASTLTIAEALHLHSVDNIVLAFGDVVWTESPSVTTTWIEVT